MASNTDPHYHHQQAGNPVMSAAAAAAAAGVSGSSTAPGGHPVFDLSKFWQEQMTLVDTTEPDFKNHPLPLARIKKVMKTDQDVKMISAEAPILFAKGCEIFITELTKRAWVHAEENKRRTLQRSDIATAISKTDMCDFLIDIVPREEASKAAASSVYDQQQNYANYYQQQTGLPGYPPHGQVPQQQMDPAYYPSISQLTPEQVQQYQLQLQQFAAAQAQQPQQQPQSSQQAAQAQGQQHFGQGQPGAGPGASRQDDSHE